MSPGSTSARLLISCADRPGIVAGPIIEQDVIRVSHRDTPARLARLGSDIERTVLARAVGWHCEDRVLVHDQTTVVF